MFRMFRLFKGPLEQKKLIKNYPRWSKLDFDSFCNDYIFKLFPKIFRWLIAIFLNFFDIHFFLLLHFYLFQSEILKNQVQSKKQNNLLWLMAYNRTLENPKKTSQRNQVFLSKFLVILLNRFGQSENRTAWKNKLNHLMGKQFNFQFVPCYIILLSTNHTLGSRLRQPCVL